MSDQFRQAAQQALEALKSVQDHKPNNETNAAITALRTALEQPEHTGIGGCAMCGAAYGDQVIKAQPEQEPVAWIDLLKQAEEVVCGKSLWKKYINGTPLANDIAVWMANFAQEHTTPPAAQPEQMADAVNALTEDGWIWDGDQWQRPPTAQWDKPSASFNEWWNRSYVDSANPFEIDSAAYWAWAGWQAAQRPWVGLEAEEILDLFDRNNVYGSKWIEFARDVEAKLKEKNNG